MTTVKRVRDGLHLWVLRFQGPLPSVLGNMTPNFFLQLFPLIKFDGKKTLLFVSTHFAWYLTSWLCIKQNQLYIMLRSEGTSARLWKFSHFILCACLNLKHGRLNIRNTNVLKFKSVTFSISNYWKLSIISRASMIRNKPRLRHHLCYVPQCGSKLNTAKRLEYNIKLRLNYFDTMKMTLLIFALRSFDINQCNCCG